MYSRFTPGPDGVYRRSQVPTPPPEPPFAEERKLRTVQPPGLKQRLNDLLPGSLELGDVLVLLIALLLLIDSEEDLQTVLIAAAAFFLL